MQDKKISKYDLDLDYAIPMIDISEEELKTIIADAEKIIAENKAGSDELAIAYLKKAQCLQKIKSEIENFNEAQYQIKRLIRLVRQPDKDVINYKHGKGEKIQSKQS